MHHCGSSWAVGHMKSGLLYLVCGVLWFLRIKLSSCVAFYIGSLGCVSLIWRAACFHKSCRNFIHLRSLAFYLMWLKLFSGLYNYWKELWQHRQKYMQWKFVHNFLLCFYWLQSLDSFVFCFFFFLIIQLLLTLTVQSCQSWVQGSRYRMSRQSARS